MINIKVLHVRFKGKGLSDEQSIKPAKILSDCPDYANSQRVKSNTILVPGAPCLLGNLDKPVWNRDDCLFIRQELIGHCRKVGPISYTAVDYFWLM